MRALVTGATGFIGRQLVSQLDDAMVLSRDAERAKQMLPGADAMAWSPEAGPPPNACFSGVDVVFNLAGEPVADGRWTAERKRRILESRVLGTRHLVAGLAAQTHRPRVLVSASAVGYYGDRGDEELDEASPPGQGFLADVCRAWEDEAMAAERLGVRVVCVRTGVVLQRGGGALAKTLTPFRLGAGGKLGTGKQWMPWIHLDDLVGILLHVSHHDEVRGAVNAVAPHPVTNAVYTRALGRALHRPTVLPVPTTALRLVFGELSEVLLASQRVLPQAVLRSGYVFQHAEIEETLAAVVSAGARIAAA